MAGRARPRGGGGGGYSGKPDSIRGRGHMTSLSHSALPAGGEAGPRGGATPPTPQAPPPPPSAGKGRPHSARCCRRRRCLWGARAPRLPPGAVSAPPRGLPGCVNRSLSVCVYGRADLLSRQEAFYTKHFYSLRGEVEACSSCFA